MQYMRCNNKKEDICHHTDFYVPIVQLQQKAHMSMLVWYNLTSIFKEAARYKAQRDIQNVWITSVFSRRLQRHLFPL